MKKRVVAIITALMMFIPMAAYADTEEFMDGAITMDVPEDWECYDSDTSTHYALGEYSNTHIFTAMRDKAVFNMMCIVDEDCYMDDAKDYSYEDQKDSYLDGGKAIVKKLLEDIADGYGFSLQVVGDVESEYTDYLKIKVKFDNDACHDIYVYFAESYEGLHEVFVLKPFNIQTGRLSDGDIEDAEYMIASLEFDEADFADYFNDEYYYDADFSDDEEYYDDEDYDYDDEWEDDETDITGFIMFIIAAISLISFLSGLGKSESSEGDGDEAEELKYESYVEDREEKVEVEKEEESSIKVPYIEREEPEEVTYQSSAGYEESLKSLLDSGLITKKEYKELLKKHGK